MHSMVSVVSTLRPCPRDFNMEILLGPREALDLAGFSSDDLHEWKHLDPELLAQLLVVVKEDLVL